MTALVVWPSETQDPYWAVRKAGVLAELGRLEEALALTQSTLVTIRRGLSDNGGHIPALSREGWALQFLRWIESASRFRLGYTGDTAVRTELRERFRKLRQFGSDPEHLSGWFTERLNSTARDRKKGWENCNHGRPRSPRFVGVFGNPPGIPALYC